MALGPGFGEGFTQGVQAGNQTAANVIKMRQLQQDSLDNKVEYYYNTGLALIKSIADSRAQAPQDSPDLNKSTEAMASHVQDLIQGISKFGDKGRVLSQALSTSLMNAKATPTMSTAATNEAKAKYSAGAQVVKAQTGVDVPPWQDSIATGPLGQQPQPAMPQAAAPQQVAQGPAAPVPPPSAPDAGASAPAAMPQAPQATPAGIAAPQGSPLTDQVQAAPGPQDMANPQQPQGIKPLVNLTPTGVLDLGEVPPEDVELIVTHPQLAAKFSEMYGVDPGSVLSGPKEPGSSPEDKAKAIMAKFMGTEEGAYEKAKAAQDVKDFSAQRKNYGDAKQLLVANLEARKKLDQGIVAGAFAGPQLTVMNALDKMGMLSKADHDKLSRTQEYVAGLSQQTAKIIKQFGAGTGLSDADREFARQAAGGDISMTEDALRHILDVNSRMAIWAMSNPQLAAPDPDMNSLTPTGAE